MAKRNTFFIVLGFMLAVGCKDADWAQLKSVGSKHKVTLYSGGVAVRWWISTGNVSNQEKSDGYYFEDDATRKLIEVSGDVVIEQL